MRRSQLSRAQDDVRLFARKVALSRYGPTPKQMERLAQLKVNVARVTEEIRRHEADCEATQ